MRYPEMKSTCKDCKERHPLCHAECEKYITAKAEHDKRRDDIKEKRKMESILRSYEIQAVRNMKNRAKKKW